MSTAPLFALVDCNAFYCNCERLFRPDLLHRPIGVLSNNDGCFVSCDRSLKDLGIKIGAPYFQYRELCKQQAVTVFSANFSLYTNISDRVMALLAQFTPTLEIYSVDEAFLDLEGMESWDLEAFGHKLRAAVLKQVGIPVSVGIAPSKTLAKLASHLGKKVARYQGVAVLTDKKVQTEALREVPVEDIWGIGRRSGLKLRGQGIKTALELRDFNNPHLLQKLLSIRGRMVQQELRGEACFALDELPEKKQQIITSRSFSSPIYDIDVLRQIVASYTALACEKMRRQDSVCSAIEVYFYVGGDEREGFFSSQARLEKLPVPTQDTRKLVEYAWKAVEHVYRPGMPHKKAGIRLSGLRSREGLQTSLFEASDSHQAEDLMQVMDIINRKEGPHTVELGSCGLNRRAWKMRQEMKSPRYVAGWTQLPKAY